MNSKPTLLLGICTSEGMPLFNISFYPEEVKNNTWRAHIAPDNGYVSSEEFATHIDKSGKQIFQTAVSQSAHPTIIGALEIIREPPKKNGENEEDDSDQTTRVVKKFIFTIYSDKHLAKPYGIPVMLMKGAPCT